MSETSPTPSKLPDYKNDYNEEVRYERKHTKQTGVSKEELRFASKEDRDRVFHSIALRRLAHVTQVVDPSEGHVFHNRLTHTLKVAQISRRLSERLIEVCKSQGITPEEIGGIDPDVVETAALIHDLGHPPFGHTSEEVLDKLVGKRAKHGGRLDGYEGNAQSFRIVNKLEVHREELEGLDLTRATLNAIMKYPWPRHRKEEDEHKHEKWGAYEDDSVYFEWARLPFAGSNRKTIEAEIMDWADDIAFSIHDLEDFYCAGLIPLDVLVRDEDARDECMKSIFAKWDAYPRQQKHRETDRIDFKNAFDTLQDWPILEPFTGTPKQRAFLRTVTSYLINRYIWNTSIKLDSTSDGFLSIPAELRMEVKVLKQLIWHYVINNPELATQQYGKAQVIKKLFRIYQNAMKSNSKWVYILPNRFEKHFKERVEAITGDAGEYERARLVADIIASFTDQEALVMYRRLTGVNPGSLVDMRSFR